MLEKIFGKKNSMQRRLIIEFIIALILVVVLSIGEFHIFISREATQIIETNIQEKQVIQELLPIFERVIVILTINSVFIGFVLIKIVSKRMLDPLEKIVQATQKVTTGDFDVRLETKRKDEVKTLVENFNYMVSELSNIECLQKDFIDNVSHEIKTPINSIQGFAKLLEDDSLSKEEKKEYIGIILEESDRLLNLSTSILELSKLQHQEKITKREEIDLTEQIQKTIALLEPKWKEKQLTISFSPNNSYFYGDENLIFQVWVNLIDNAIKFSKDKGAIEISIQESQDEIIIKIKDNGIGMNKEDIKKIFTRFYQVDTSHSGKGSGLGLSIVKRIIVLSNGTINVESQKDVGTTIIVKLPKLNQINKILIL